MIEYTSLASLIPVLVTGIQQRHVRAAQDQNTTGIGAVKTKAPVGLPTQAGWIPVASTGTRALAASAAATIQMRECRTA
jgi:hypothetical protein